MRTLYSFLLLKYYWLLMTLLFKCLFEIVWVSPHKGAKTWVADSYCSRIVWLIYWSCPYCVHTSSDFTDGCFLNHNLAIRAISDWHLHASDMVFHLSLASTSCFFADAEMALFLKLESYYSQVLRQLNHTWILSLVKHRASKPHYLVNSFGSNQFLFICFREDRCCLEYCSLIST